MKLRHVIFDLFGDYLRHRGGEIRLRDLVALLGHLGVPEPTVRVVAARLRKEGFLTSRREGRETVYSLSEQGWWTLDERRFRIFIRPSGPWDGQWSVIIYHVPETERALREQLRKRLTLHGYGPLAPSVWISPHDRSALVRPDLAGNPVVRLDIFRGRSEGPEKDRDMVERAWDLATLDRDYAALLDSYRPRLAAYRAGEVHGPAALAERLQLLDTYRSFPFRDPYLPPELLPEDWSGRAAHEMFLEAYGLLRAPAEAFVESVLHGSRVPRVGPPVVEVGGP